MCHSSRVTLFRLNLKPGESIFDQLVFAAKKAFISGEFQAGQAFPSVRTLAAEFKIHPNTAHKVIQHLIQGRWLESRPGIGSGPSQETAVITAITRFGAGAITVASPLKLAHAPGVEVSGSGITLTAPLSRAHAIEEQITGSISTPGAPNNYYRKP